MGSESSRENVSCKSNALLTRLRANAKLKDFMFPDNDTNEYAFTIGVPGHSFGLNFAYCSDDPRIHVVPFNDGICAYSGELGYANNKYLQTESELIAELLRLKQMPVAGLMDNVGSTLARDPNHFVLFLFVHHKSSTKAAASRMAIPSESWSITNFVSRAANNEWLPNSIRIEVLSIIGRYFCPTGYEWKPMACKDDKDNDQITKSTYVSIGDYGRVAVFTGSYCYGSIFAAGLSIDERPYFAVRVRIPSKAADFSISVGFGCPKSYPLSVRQQPPSSEFKMYGIFGRTNCFCTCVDKTAYVMSYQATADYHILTTDARNRTTADRKHGLAAMTADSYSVVIGTVYDAASRTTRFYLDNEIVIDNADLDSEFVWKTEDLAGCRPYATAFGIPAEFELLNDWRPPANDSERS